MPILDRHICTIEFESYIGSARAGKRPFVLHFIPRAAFFSLFLSLRFRESSYTKYKRNFSSSLSIDFQRLPGKVALNEMQQSSLLFTLCVAVSASASAIGHRKDEFRKGEDEFYPFRNRFVFAAYDDSNSQEDEMSAGEVDAVRGYRVANIFSAEEKHRPANGKLFI